MKSKSTNGNVGAAIWLNCALDINNINREFSAKVPFTYRICDACNSEPFEHHRQEIMSNICFCVEDGCGMYEFERNPQFSRRLQLAGLKASVSAAKSVSSKRNQKARFQFALDHVVWARE